MNLKQLQNQIHQINKDKGFYEKPNEFGTNIALIHSELSEALEAHRDNNPPSTKIDGFSSIEEELADVVIRVLDLSEAEGFDLFGAVEAKVEFNAGRTRKHGKGY